MGQAIHHHLCAIQLPQAKNNALRVITLLARNHIPELVAAFLDLSTPLDRYLALPSSLTPLPTLHPFSSRGHSFGPPVCPSQSTGTQSAWCREGGQHPCSFRFDSHKRSTEMSVPPSTTHAKGSLTPQCSWQDPCRSQSFPALHSRHPAEPPALSGGPASSPIPLNPQVWG